MLFLQPYVGSSKFHQIISRPFFSRWKWKKRKQWWKEWKRREEKGLWWGEKGIFLFKLFQIGHETDFKLYGTLYTPARSFLFMFESSWKIHNDLLQMVLNDLALAAPVASSQNSFTDRTQLTLQKDLPVFAIYTPTVNLIHRPAGSTSICNIFTDRTQLTVQKDLPVFVIYSPT